MHFFTQSNLVVAVGSNYLLLVLFPFGIEYTASSLKVALLSNVVKYHWFSGSMLYE